MIHFSFVLFSLSLHLLSVCSDSVQQDDLSHAANSEKDKETRKAFRHGQNVLQLQMLCFWIILPEQSWLLKLVVCHKSDWLSDSVTCVFYSWWINGYFQQLLLIFFYQSKSCSREEKTWEGGHTWEDSLDRLLADSEDDETQRRWEELERNLKEMYQKNWRK